MEPSGAGSLSGFTVLDTRVENGAPKYTQVAMATAPIFAPALASLGNLVPHDGILSPEELEELAIEIVARPDICEPLVRTDPEQRRYELICEDERMDAWVLSWMPGQGTGFQFLYRCFEHEGGNPLL